MNHTASKSSSLSDYLSRELVAGEFQRRRLRANFSCGYLIFAPSWTDLAARP